MHKDLIVGCLREICHQLEANLDFVECSEEKKKLVVPSEFKEKLNLAKEEILQAISLIA